jgi:hypothetical protein
MAYPDLASAMRMLSESGADVDQPRSGFRTLARIFADYPGYLLFSVSSLENKTWLRRIFSTDPDRHPVNATKDMEGTRYCSTVVAGRSHLLCRSDDDLRASFQDHAAIIASGVGSSVNLCLRFDGRVVGSANFLGVPAAYGPATVDDLAVFAFPLALLVVHAARIDETNDRNRVT